MHLTNAKICRTEKRIASVSEADADDVDIAVKAARRALKDPSWATIESSARGLLLLKLADLAEAHAHQLATIEAWDNGKIEAMRKSSLFTNSASLSKASHTSTLLQ
jgi:aldehyde dehydrogenase (NAD+)